MNPRLTLNLEAIKPDTIKSPSPRFQGEVMDSFKLSPIPAGKKRAALTEVLTRLARHLGPGKQLPGVREMCKSLNVSTATLDRVLVKLETQQIISREHGRGLFVADSLKKDTIGFVFGGDVFAVSPFWGQLLECGQKYALKHDLGFRYYLDIPDSGKTIPTHGDLIGDLENKRLNAIVVLSPQGNDQVQWLQQWNLPTVLLDQEHVCKYKAFFDHACFIAIAVEQLAKAGCKRIGFLGSTFASANQVFIDALTKEGLAYDRALHWDISWCGSLVPHESFEQFASNLLDKAFPSTQPDGLVISDDTMARGAMIALLRQGVFPGRDIKMAVASNKGSSVLQPYEGDLILIEHDPAELIEQVMQIIEQLLREEEPPEPVIMVKPAVRR